MITKIRLVNFKSHKDTEIELGKLTILCGSNGVGKSSFIQILLLLREALLKDKSFDMLDLKSNPVKIGTVNDAIYEFGTFDGFKVDLKFSEDIYLNFHYEAKSEDELVKSIINSVNKSAIISQNVSHLSLFNKNFQYISAARKGPQEQYGKNDKIVDVNMQISDIEGQAEYFVHFLDKYRNVDVIDELCILNNENSFKDLYTQVILWEKYIFNGANAEIQDIGKLGYLLKYSFDSEKSPTNKTKGFDAKNVGFGLTYTIPLLVAILSAPKNALVIIENPEAHLHPSGISKLAELICLAAQAGIQIILETHSDHIINGVLVQTKKFEKPQHETGIDRNNVSIYQFERYEKEHHSTVLKINVEESGRIRVAPKGFFDQIQHDLEQILDF